MPFGGMGGPAQWPGALGRNMMANAVQQQNQYGVQYPPDHMYGTLQPNAGTSMMKEAAAGAPTMTLKPSAGPIAPMKAHGAQLQDAQAPTPEPFPLRLGRAAHGCHSTLDTEAFAIEGIETAFDVPPNTVDRGESGTHSETVGFDSESRRLSATLAGH